jgi:hypothetical protein
MSGYEISNATEILNVCQYGEKLGTLVKHKETFNIVMISHLTVIIQGTLFL